MESAVVLTTVMKGVADALKLDGDGNRPKEAYVKYLECIFRITTKLLQNVKSDGGQVHITKEVVRFVRLGNQCMERMVAIVNQFSTGISSDRQNLPVRSEGQFLPPESKSAPATPVNQTSLEFGAQDSRFRLSSAPSPLPITTSSQSKQKVLTPSEVAMMKNHQLMIAYKTRMGGLGTRKSAAASLSLTLQRKIAENLAIAKAQEEALTKKIQERQLRLEEQAARKFNSVDGMSEEEEHKKEIYKKVLEYEQDTSWLTDLRLQLQENPDDAKLMQQLILGILKCSDHPLTQQLKLYQFKLYEKIHPLVSKKIEYLSEIKVPLSTSLFPPGVAKVWNDSQETKEDSDSDSIEEDEEEEEADVFDKDEQTETQDEYKSVEVIDDNSNIETEETQEEEESENVTVKNLTDISSDVKEDLEIALEKGEKVKTQLKQENKEVKKILRQMSNDIEKYSLENMDDLFDDDEDDDNGDDDNDQENDKWMPPPYSSLSAPDKNSTDDSSEMDKDPRNSDQSKSDSKSCDTHNSNLSESNKKSSDKSGSAEDSKSSSPNRRHSSSNKTVGRPRVEQVQAMDKQLSEMKNEAYHRHLKGISQDVQTYLEKIQALFTMTYEQLDSPAGQDQCYACLEKPFFQPIWQYLISLYRLANEPKEIAVAYVMTRYQNSTPKDFNISKKLRLDQGLCDEDNNYPYQPAVAQVQAITTQCTLLDKLECLVRSSRQICQCIEDHYKGNKESGGKVPSVGADDLLPILCYVIIKAAQPQIVSECHIMEEFIHEGYIMGEEGYCLTSLQTALAYLTSLGMVDQS